MTDKEKAELMEMESSNDFVLEGFTWDEILTLRMLVTDRIESRFRNAQKAASENNLPILSSVTHEIEKLNVLMGKLKQEVWDEEG